MWRKNGWMKEKKEDDDDEGSLYFRGVSIF